MKKLLFSICSVCFLNSIAYSQIGIYTENPRSILHIDALGNNSSVGVPSVIEQKDDVFFSIDGNETPSLTIGSSPRTGINDAQLELASNSKGFLPNKVALNSNQDVITIPSPQNGMIVYNTVTRGSGVNSVTPGLYVFYNSKWNYIFLENLKIPNTRTLQADLTLGLGNSTQSENAITANYGDPIKIETDGAYSFALRLFIRSVNPSDIIAPQRLIVYVWLFQNDTVADVAELNPIIFPPAGGNDIASYSVVLSAELQKNDNITMRFSRHRDSPSVKLAANGTKDNVLVYWRLEQYNVN